MYMSRNGYYNSCSICGGDYIPDKIKDVNNVICIDWCTIEDKLLSYISSKGV